MSVPSKGGVSDQPPPALHSIPQQRISLPDNSAQDISTPSRDTDWLLNANTAYITRAESAYERTIAPYRSLLPLKGWHAPKFSWQSGLHAFNPFNKDGREKLRRKIPASEPASTAKELKDDKPRGCTRWIKSHTGWRMGTWACCSAVVLSIVIELVLLLWAIATSMDGPNSGLLYEGNCERVKNMTVWLLLPLNIAATALISTSNYVMQVLTCPSRAEIDQAHESAQAVIVCGMSPTHFGASREGRLKRILWWLLMLSSIPIHLLLNSAFYSSVQASNTGILVVSDGFEDDTSWNSCNANLNASSPSASFTCSLIQSFNAGDTRELSRTQCLSQYAGGFQTNASSVIVVAAAGSDSWYNPPPIVSVPDLYGLACSWQNSSLISESQRHYTFSYDQKAGSATVSLDFAIKCDNVTHKNESTKTIDSYEITHDNDPNWSSYESENGSLFYTADDELSKIPSIRSVFSAIDYRYWATSELLGDYLIPSSKRRSKGWETRSWLCPKTDLLEARQCDTTNLRKGTDWKITPAEIPVVRCHVYPKQELCALRYSWRILLVTICCDIIKLLAMILVLRFVSQPLTTLGDVIASFLQNPDPCTQGRCLLDEDEACKWVAGWQPWGAILRSWQNCVQSGQRGFEKDVQIWRDHNIPFEGSGSAQYSREAWNWIQNGGSWWTNQHLVAQPRAWAAKNRRWVNVPSRTRWQIFALLYSSSIAAAVTYFVFGWNALRTKGLSNVWIAGFDGPDPNALFEGGFLSSANHITWAAFIANLPQLLFSMLYFVFNSIITTMYSANEWAEFAQHRKALRVSSPEGQQRSSYWLQLPWAYSLPLIAASGSLHWLLGRSVYLVKVDVYDYFGKSLPQKDFFACGYSPITVLAIIILLMLMGLALLMISIRKLTSGSLLVMFNSLAISAACHPDPAEREVALQPLMWGVVQGEKIEGTENGVGHCSFSARRVSSPSEEEVYS